MIKHATMRHLQKSVDATLIMETFIQTSQALGFLCIPSRIQLSRNQLTFLTDSLVRMRTKYVPLALFPRGNMMLLSLNILHHGLLIHNG